MASCAHSPHASYRLVLQWEILRLTFQERSGKTKPCMTKEEKKERQLTLLQLHLPPLKKGQPAFALQDPKQCYISAPGNVCYPKQAHIACPILL